MDYIVSSGIVAVFFGLLGVYVMLFRHINITNRKLSEIYETVNKHVADRSCHEMINTVDFVSKTVCSEIQKKNDMHFSFLTESARRQEKKLDKLIEKLT